jgi:Icc-related predicted phosphoesterase
MTLTEIAEVAEVAAGIFLLLLVVAGAITGKALLTAHRKTTDTTTEDTENTP